MQSEKEKVTTIEPKKETENASCYTGRADYYPFNQTFLDEYYKRWKLEKAES